MRKGDNGTGDQRRKDTGRGEKRITENKQTLQRETVTMALEKRKKNKTKEEN